MPPKKEKMKEDLSPLVEKILPEQIALAKSGKLEEAIENLYGYEKQTRHAEDQLSTSRIAIHIVRLCFEARRYDLLNQNLQVLSKRRGQMRTVIQDFVGEAMKYIDQLDKPQKLELLDTLRQITEGKIFVEIERARLTKILAKIREAEGNLNEAAEIMQEIQVETFGQMDRFEKTEFILEQVRLCLAKKDFIRAQILSNKISKKAINEKEFQDLKVRYFHLMIQYYSHQHNYFEICKCYMSLYDTPKVKENDTEWKKYLAFAVIYIILSPFNNEQSDLIARISLDKNHLEKLPIYKKLITVFTTKEIMPWDDFQKLFGAELHQYDIFTDMSSGKNQEWSDLQKRLIEHNLRVISGYYSRITMKRLSQLLSLSLDEVEQHISNLVVSQSIYAKIDRPSGIVSFTKPKDPNEFLTDWSHDIARLLTLMERTNHLIDRENMVYKIE
jgi:26S proteasome regulatory subunit N5